MYIGWLRNYELDHHVTLTKKEKREMINKRRREQGLSDFEWNL